MHGLCQRFILARTVPTALKLSNKHRQKIHIGTKHESIRSVFRVYRTTSMAFPCLWIGCHHMLASLQSQRRLRSLSGVPHKHDRCLRIATKQKQQSLVGPIHLHPSSRTTIHSRYPHRHKEKVSSKAISIDVTLSSRSSMSGNSGLPISMETGRTHSGWRY